MGKCLFRRLALLAALAAAGPTALTAQAVEGGSVSGRVRDEEGAALPGVTVEVVGLDAFAGPGRRHGRRRRLSGREPAGRGLPRVVPASQLRRRRARDVVVDAGRGGDGRRDAAPVGLGRRRRHGQAHVPQPRRRDTSPGESLVGIADASIQGVVTAEQIALLPIAPPGRRARDDSRVSSSASTAAKARRTSTTCAASTSTTAPTSRPPSPACRSTCRRTRTARATRT